MGRAPGAQWRALSPRSGPTRPAPPSSLRQPYSILTQTSQTLHQESLNTFFYLHNCVGIDEHFDGDSSGLDGNTTCGQATSFDFTQQYTQVPTPEPPNPFPVEHPDFYSLLGFDWNKVKALRFLSFSFFSLSFLLSTRRPGGRN